MLSSFSFSVMSLLVRVGGARLPSFEMVFCRAVVALVLTWALLRHAGVDVWGRDSHRGLLALRGLFGLGALSCFFYSVTHMPLAEATVIQFTSPIFTAVLASLFLGEHPAPRVWAAISLGLTGVLLITRPAAVFTRQASELPMGVVVVGLCGAFVTACAHVLIRRLAPHEHELVVVFYFPLIAAPVALVAAVPVWVWPTAWEWLLLAAIGVAGQAAQVYLTRGVKYIRAASASAILYLQILFATFWGLTVLGERPDLWTVSGSLLVLGGTLVASRRPRLPA